MRPIPFFGFLVILCITIPVADISADQYSLWRDEVDEFTDKRHLEVLLVTEDIDSEFIGVVFLKFVCHFERKSVSVLLTLSSPWYDVFKDNQTIKVRLRFDQNPPFEEEWNWIGHLYMAGMLQAAPLFDKALASNRLILSGAYREVIRFDLAEARDDLLAFKHRCDTVIQRP